VQIRYARGQRLRVMLIEPRLQPDEQELQNLYPNGDLCLDRLDERGPSMLLDEGIVPLTAEWLAHYELWKTYEQYGDGDGPASP
jgi:hypothetical protein